MDREISCRECVFCRKLYVPPCYPDVKGYICTAEGEAMYMPDRSSVCELFTEEGANESNLG